MIPRSFALTIATLLTSSLLTVPALADHDSSDPREALTQSLLRHIPEPVEADPNYAEEYEAALRLRTIGDEDNEPLSDEQVRTMLQALHNTQSNGLVPRIEPEDLDAMIDGGYGAKAVRAAVQGYEKEARFLDKASRFAEGSPQQTRALEKAAGELDKFRAKADDHASREAARMAKHEARDMARSHGRDLGRDEARRAAREQAKADRQDNGKARAKGKNK